MKIPVTILMILMLAACSNDRTQRLPTAPAPSGPGAPIPNASASLWGMVIDASGACIEGATVEIVRGERLGDRVAQTTPCGAWDYGGGFVITNLTPAYELTLRASAPGYVAREVAFNPALASGPQQAVLITLSSAR